jgi:hypothetical protein
MKTDVLDAYIIEEIKKQEEERRRRDEAGRPRLRIEIPDEAPEHEPPDEEEKEDTHREPIRIDL